ALLKDRIREKIAAAFMVGKSTSSFQALRDSLSQRCESLLINIRDIDLKAFCLRLLDNVLPEPDWLESVGSYVANTPPVRWKDEEQEVKEIEQILSKLLKANDRVSVTAMSRVMWRLLGKTNDHANG